MADVHTLTLSADQCAIIRIELPRGSEFRAKMADAWGDATTWGEADVEFDSAEWQQLSNLGFPWLDELIAGDSLNKAEEDAK